MEDDGRWWKMLCRDKLCSLAETTRLLMIYAIYMLIFLPVFPLQGSNRLDGLRSASHDGISLFSILWVGQNLSESLVCGRIEEAEAGPLQQAWRHIAHKADKIRPTADITRVSRFCRLSILRGGKSTDSPAGSMPLNNLTLLLDLWTAAFCILVHTSNILAFPYLSLTASWSPYNATSH